jgi:MFS family permease
MSTDTQSDASWRPLKLKANEIVFATWIAFLAWACAVYDFILFGTLLPEIGKDIGLDQAGQASLATWVALGTVVVALSVGPIVDRFGRRFGMMFTVGGAGIASALTALAGSVSHSVLIIIRALSGLGYAEQAVNGTYLSELYHAAEDPRVREKRGFIYSLVQGGWPIGALAAAGLTALLFPIVGWKGCFVFAAVPAIIVALLASRLRESPQFEVSLKIRQLKERGHVATAQQLALAHHVEEDAHHGPSISKAFKGSALRATLSLGLGHLLNWFPVQVFSVLGTTVITSVHNISFTNSLFILILSNLIAYTGYLTHGFFGDKFGRRWVIAIGWFLGGIAFTAMLYGPSNYFVVVALYSLGQFFLIGPYSCVLFFVGESYSSAIRGTGSALVNGIGPMGAVLASFGAATLLTAGGDWRTAAFWFGAVPCALSGLVVLAARDVRAVHKPLHIAPDEVPDNAGLI